MAAGGNRRDRRGLLAVVAVAAAAAGCGLGPVEDRAALPPPEDAAITSTTAAATTTSPPATDEACRAVARWGALAVPGADDPQERAAWADVEAAMVSVTDPATLAAHRQLVDAWNRGAQAVYDAAGAEMARVGEAMERNAAERDRVSREAIAGNWDAALDMQHETYVPDLRGLAEAKAAARVEISAAVDRFTAHC